MQVGDAKIKDTVAHNFEALALHVRVVHPKREDPRSHIPPKCPVCNFVPATQASNWTSVIDSDH